MPNFISFNDDVWKLPDDPTKAAQAATDIKNLGAGNATFASITGKITNQDASVVQLKGKSLFKVNKETGK